jgi:hypothetical protein
MDITQSPGLPEPDKAGRLESLYDAASWLGLALIVLGTSAQVFAAVMAR